MSVHRNGTANVVKPSSEVQIQVTNDYSTLSKCSTAQFGYIKDEYISSLIPFSNRRSPLIHMGYYVRVMVIDTVLEEFLKFTRGGPAQIISLGAGFDSTVFRLQDNIYFHEGIVYYEIDYKEVVAKKAEIIYESDVLTQVVGKLAAHMEVGFGGNKYWLLACDLRNLCALEEKMTHANVDFKMPTLFLAECSITYMDEKSSSNLISWAAGKFENSTFVTYEQVYPYDGFGIVMRQHFRTQGTPLRSMLQHPELRDHEIRYYVRGWPVCNARSVWDFFRHHIDRIEQMRAFKIEPFDEFEEWHLKCCHYTLVVATRGSLENWADSLMDPVHIPLHIPCGDEVRWTRCEVQNVEGTVERFGHGSSCVPLYLRGNNGAVLLVGGFGASSSGHRRIDTVCLLTNLPKDSCGPVLPTRVVQCKFDSSGEGRATLAAMYPTCTTLSHNKSDVMARVLLFGGRTSPSKPANNEGFLLHVPVSHPDEKVCVTAHRLSQPGTVWDRPRGRWRHTAVEIPPSHSQPWARVLVFGGRSASYEVFSDLWLLTIAAEVCRVTFKKLEPAGPQPVGRFAHSATALRERTGMAVSGGLDQNLLPLADVWLYDVGEKQWHKLQMEGPGMYPRYSHTSAIYKGHLILVGGVNTLAGCQPGVAVINMKLRRCTEYALPAQDPAKPILLHNHTMEQLTEDGRIQLIIGGGGNCFSFGTACNESLLKLDLGQFVPKEAALDDYEASSCSSR